MGDDKALVDNVFGHFLPTCFSKTEAIYSVTLVSAFAVHLSYCLDETNGIQYVNL